MAAECWQDRGMLGKTTTARPVGDVTEGKGVVDVICAKHKTHHFFSALVSRPIPSTIPSPSISDALQ